jgi:hypothetical protein
MGSIDLGRGRPPEEIRAMIVAAYAERGWEPPTDFTWIARYLSAGTARHARPLRLAIELGKSVQGAVRTLREENRRMGGDDGDTTVAWLRECYA